MLFFLSKDRQKSLYKTQTVQNTEKNTKTQRYTEINLQKLPLLTNYKNHALYAFYRLIKLFFFFCLM